MAVGRIGNFNTKQLQAMSRSTGTVLHKREFFKDLYSVKVRYIVSIVDHSGYRGVGANLEVGIMLNGDDGQFTGEVQPLKVKDLFFAYNGNVERHPDFDQSVFVSDYVDAKTRAMQWLSEECEKVEESFK